MKIEVWNFKRCGKLQGSNKRHLRKQYETQLLVSVNILAFKEGNTDEVFPNNLQLLYK